MLGLCWFAVLLSAATLAMAWHHPLAGDGGDYWQTPIKVGMRSTALSPDPDKVFRVR